MSHVRRFDHVGRTVADLDVVTAFFVALDLEHIAIPGGDEVYALLYHGGLVRPD